MLNVLVLVHYLLGRKILSKHKSRNVCQQGNSVISIFSVFYDMCKLNALSFFVKVSNIRLILIFNKPFTSLRSDLWILQNLIIYYWWYVFNSGDVRPPVLVIDLATYRTNYLIPLTVILSQRINIKILHVLICQLIIVLIDL